MIRGLGVELALDGSYRSLKIQLISASRGDRPIEGIATLDIGDLWERARARELGVEWISDIQRYGNDSQSTRRR